MNQTNYRSTMNIQRNFRRNWKIVIPLCSALIVASVVSGGEPTLGEKFALLEPYELIVHTRGGEPELAMDGNTVAFGTHGYDDSPPGQVSVLHWDGTSWVDQVLTNLPLDRIAFGSAVAVNRDTLVVGDFYSRIDQNYAAGAGYVFERTGTNWNYSAPLVASDGAARDHFGYSVAVDGDLIVVGAFADDDHGDASGSAYVFERNGSNWSELAKLTADDGAAGDQFGYDVALAGELIVVGAPAPYSARSGAVYLFERSGTNIIQKAKLVPDEGANHSFGISVAIDGARLAVGAPPKNINYSGTVYLFQNDDDRSWVRETKLYAYDATPYDHFGASVALDGSHLLVGAPRYSGPETSAVYFTSLDDAGYPQEKLAPAGLPGATGIGDAVALEGDKLVLSGRLSDGGGRGAYVFSPAYNNPTNVATYARRFLYRSDAQASPFHDPALSAFRYLELLYQNEAGRVRIADENIDALYGATEMDLANFVKEEIRKALAVTPSSDVLGNMLLDVHYHQSLAASISAANLTAETGQGRFEPPSVPAGLVIDDEMARYREILSHHRSALKDYFSLLTDELGETETPPRGYQIFQQRLPHRGLAPMEYDDGNGLQPVGGTSGNLFDGYKDLVLLHTILRDYGRAATHLARLLAAGDPGMAGETISGAKRFLYLHSRILAGVFPDLQMDDPALENSGLTEARDAIGTSLDELERLKQNLVGKSNPLGFESDFLMLAQKFAGGSEDVFDSFDAFALRLNPDDLSSPLGYALTLQREAVESFADYQGFQDQLESQLSSITASAEDRLFQIVGAFPNTPEYQLPEHNEGGEIWLQLNSIEAARVQIEKNRVELSNLEQEIQIEIERSDDVQEAVIYWGNSQAKLTRWIGHINAVQAASEAIARAGEFVTWGASLTDAVIQAGGEEAKGQLESRKEEYAAMEKARIEHINNAARVKTLALGMNTLVIESQEAALTMKQERGRLTALLREKEDLERTLAESQTSLADRYFADPTHHLRYLHQAMLANISFDEAQTWLYFMARALEYKWNTPFANYFHLGRKWSTDTLFRLRNAGELLEFYNAMVSFNSLVQLPRDDYFDWFSVREDFLGYVDLDESGAPLFYADPTQLDAPPTLRAKEAFRRYLRSRMDAIGNIRLVFSTRREIPGGTFYRGARYDENRNLLSAGLFLDKIKWMKINLPGNHSLGRSQLAGELSYGGNGFVRNFDVGTFHPDRPDRLQNEETAYSTRYWFFHAPSARWRFSESLGSPVTMQLSADSRVPPSVREIDVFKERSVATTGWKLTIPTEDLGVPVLNVDELDDIELYFYHYAVSRQLPEGNAAVQGEDASNVTGREIPFPYSLRRDIVDRSGRLQKECRH